MATPSSSSVEFLISIGTGLVLASCATKLDLAPNTPEFCAQLESKETVECFRHLGDLAFSSRAYGQATTFYESGQTSLSAPRYQTALYQSALAAASVGDLATGRSILGRLQYAQKDAALILGDAAFENRKYSHALSSYDDAGVPASSPRLRVSIYEVATADLQQGRLEKAEAGFLRYGYSPQEVSLLFGDHFLRSAETIQDFEKAANQLERAGIARVTALGLVAEQSLGGAIQVEQQDFESAMAQFLIAAGYDPRPAQRRLHRKKAAELNQEVTDRESDCRKILATWKERACPVINLPTEEVCTTEKTQRSGAEEQAWAMKKQDALTADIGAGAQAQQSHQYAFATLLDNLDQRLRTNKVCSNVGGGTERDESRAQALQQCAKGVAELSKRSLEHYRKADEAALKELEQKSSSWSKIELEVGKNPCPADTRKVVTP
jgi:hypothetical protein